MILKVFSVYDTKAAAYLPPFLLPTRGMAVRAFTAAALEETHDFHKFADDYVLFELGDFDPMKGQFVNYTVPEMVQTARSVIVHHSNKPLRAVDGGLKEDAGS